MYSIQFSDWGLVLEFIGSIPPEMMHDWFADVQQLTGGFSEPFSVIVDVQQARPSADVVEDRLLQGLFVLEQAGMERVAVVVGEQASWARFCGVERGPAGLRHFVARPDVDWLVKVHAWVQRGIDPQSDEAAASRTDP